LEAAVYGSDFPILTLLKEVSMSLDTTVVIAALVYKKRQGEREYTAKVVQSADDLLTRDEWALKKAKLEFLETHSRPYWFSTLQLAKQFAALLTQDQDARGGLEYRHQPIIEINLDEGCVYPLSRKGKRKVSSHGVPHGSGYSGLSETRKESGSRSVSSGPGWRSETGHRSVTHSVTGRAARNSCRDR
jgi:hypothetical protein